MNDDNQPQAVGTPSVAGRVLATFVDALAEDPELKDVAERLRTTLRGGGSISEVVLRQALFGDSAV